MAATYAGILGSLAFNVVVLRSVKDGGAAEPTMLASALGLLTFAIVGYIVGRIAHMVIEESVRQKFHAELVDASSKQATNHKPDQTTES